MLRSTRRSVLGLVALLAAGSLLPVCKRKTQGITLGLYASMTGDQAEFGRSTRNGVQIAIDEINGRGGLLGHPVRLVVEDTRGDTGETVNAVSRLITREGVTGLIGEIASSLSKAGGPVAQREHVPMITPSSTNETVTRIGDYVFRVCFTDNFQGRVMAHFAYDDLHVRKVAILKDEGSAYSTGLAQSFREVFTALGGQIVDEQSYRASDTHFPQLGTVLTRQPEALFVPGYYTQVTLIARESRGQGFTGPLLGGDGWDGPPIYQNDDDKLVGSYFSEGYAPDHPVTERGRRFAEEYHRRYHIEANGLAALGYDAALVMADAILRAGSGDRPRIRNAIAETRNFEGATGTISIDAQRNAVKGAVVLQVQPTGVRFHRAFSATELQ